MHPPGFGKVKECQQSVHPLPGRPLGVAPARQPLPPDLDHFPAIPPQGPQVARQAVIPKVAFEFEAQLLHLLPQRIMQVFPTSLADPFETAPQPLPRGLPPNHPSPLLTLPTVMGEAQKVEGPRLRSPRGRLPSERFNTRATHIQCWPRQPRESFAVHQRLPANRMRSATATGAVGRRDAKAVRSRQSSGGLQAGGRPPALDGIRIRWQAGADGARKSGFGGAARPVGTSLGVRDGFRGGKSAEKARGQD